MIYLVQLAILLITFVLRGHSLFGWHLWRKKNPPRMECISRGRYGSIRARFVGIKQDHGIPFSIRKERWYHRWLKDTGIATEITLGDEAFDSTYFISTDFPDHLEQSVTSEQLLEQLKALFKLPITALYATRRRLWCVIDSPDLAKPAEYFQQHLDILKKISALSAATANMRATKPLRRIYAFCFLGLHASLLTLGLFDIVVNGLDRFEMRSHGWFYVLGLSLGGILAAVWAGIIWVVFKRSSWICWVLMDFALAGLPGLLFLGMMAVRYANVFLPQPAPHIYIQPIVAKSCTLICHQPKGKHGITHHYNFLNDEDCTPSKRASIALEAPATDSVCGYSTRFAFHIYFKHWERSEIFSLKEPSQILFDAVTETDLLAIPVHRGALGTAWIDTHAIQGVKK